MNNFEKLGLLSGTLFSEIFPKNLLQSNELVLEKFSTMEFHNQSFQTFEGR